MLTILLLVPIGWSDGPAVPVKAKQPVVVHVAGKVETSDGAPVEGATVWWQGPTPPGVAAPTGSFVKTDAKGEFRVPVLLSDPDKTSRERYLMGEGFDVFADRYVRLQERLRVEERVVEDPAKGVVRNFRLAAGEVIEGQVKVKAFEPFVSELTVRGPSFRQVFMTDLEGRFKIWVPKGLHTLSALDAKSSGLNRMRRDLGYAAKGANRPVTVEVSSGTKGVVIAD